MEQETQFNKAVIVKMDSLYVTDDLSYSRDILKAKVFNIKDAKRFVKTNNVGVVKILNQYEYNNIILDRIEELKGKLLILK